MEKKNEVIKTNNKTAKVIDIILGIISGIAFLFLLIIAICLIVDFFYKIATHEPENGFNEYSIPHIILMIFNAFYSVVVGLLLLTYIVFSIVISVIKKKGLLKISLISNICLLGLYLAIWIFVFVIKLKYY